ncbi:S-adenosyl-L-methionine-dependent methyltransferase [Xylariales sp. PMI_506]|nr:S-adenosyl-L-methionine-dependent methyltransferase [Xylariales sp. PMI_506]
MSRQQGQPALSGNPVPEFTPIEATVPSLIQEQYGMRSVPTRLYSEDISQAQDVLFSGNHVDASATMPPWNHQVSFAEVANNLINESLGRVPSGGSIVEPNSILDESGRLYHGYKEGKYLLPNDAAEQDRLDLQQVFRQLMGGWLALAPMTSIPKYVLDIGTGTGLWASEFAEQNPNSYVVGIDLSNIQPAPTLPNCTYIRADAEDDWIFEKSQASEHITKDNGLPGSKILFDYIHLRMMFTCFSNVISVMKHSFENLEAGGWIEFQETRMRIFQANPAYPGDALQRWADGCIQGGTAVGRDFEAVLNYESWLKDVGFVNVTQRVLIGPFGEWPTHPSLKLAGRYNLQNMLEGVQGSWKLLKYANLTSTEIEGLVRDAQLQLRDKHSHSYSLM